MYILSLVWIPFIVWLALGDSVDMEFLVLTVVELIGIPLILSRLLTKVKINKDVMAIVLNCCIFFMVWLSVGSTKFGGNAWWLFLVFIVIAALRSFGLGFTVETVEKRQ